MIQITQAAREKIQSLVDAEVVREPALRIGLAPDADRRSPLQLPYVISLVERDDKERTEIAINVEGIRVLLNLDTSNLLSGATIDWLQDEAASGFQVRTPEPARPAPRASREGSAASGPLAERIQAVFDELVNPRIAAHGGAVELVDLEENNVYIRMSGGCQGCSASAATLRMGIERTLREEIPEVGEIHDVTDHEAGVTP
ncbi:MAG TPA: NifU family protein, partial [Longimicrobiaceae bacterium]|nr:NifU family protein [Longimicrobiaceae bacterium]